MQKWQWKKAGTHLLFVLLALAVALVVAMPLTRFQLADRAASTAGLQKITIACPSALGRDFETGLPLPQLKIESKIKDIQELEQYSCRQINLEDIEKEGQNGFNVLEVYRPDPNVNIRAEIYQKSWQQIKMHSVFGIGWGSISQILGVDERGAGLNASNIFLEVWLGSGLLGILSLVILFGYILVSLVGVFLNNGDKHKNGTALLFVMTGWAAVVFPNLFNSGIFLGFVWSYLAVAISLLNEKKI